MPTAASLPEPARPELAGDAEFARVLRICDPGAALDGPLTFSPAKRQTSKAWMAAWQQWRDTVLEPVLAPFLATAAGHAQRDHAREMLVLDADLRVRLEPAAAARCAAAGRRLLQQLGTARGSRWLGKFSERIAQEDADAHFPIVYAGQSALFHLPMRLLLPTYAYWEWCAALAACSFTGPRPDFAAETGGWQRLADATLSPSLFHPADPLSNAGRAS